MADCNSIGNDITVEYDRILFEMKQQIEFYRAEVEKLVSRVESVTLENERLHVNLKNAYELNFKNQTEKLGADMLKQELEVAQTNDTEMSNTSRLQKELTTSKKELKVAKKSHQNLQELYDKLLIEHQQSLEEVMQFQLELSAMKKELHMFQKQAKDSNQRNVELQTLLDNTRQQKSSPRVSTTENSSDQKAYILMTANTELKSKVAFLQEEVARLLESESVHEMKVTSLNEKLQQLQSREQTAVSHVKESMQLLETALAEKEQTDIKEQHYMFEIKHLQQKVACLIDEAGSRTKQEVEKIKSEYNEKIDAMASEIQELEKESGAKQSLVEKLQREKEEIHKELKMSSLQFPEEQIWIKDVLNEVRSKLLQSERNCDNLSSEIKRLKTANCKLERSLLVEKQTNSELLENLQCQRKQNQSDSQHFRNEINLLSSMLSNYSNALELCLDKCKVLQEQVNKATCAQEETENMCQNKVRQINEEFVVKEKEFMINLKCAQETHRKIALELKHNLLAHQQAANRWQKEMFDLNNKFEKHIAEMNSKLVEAKQNNKDIVSKLHQVTTSNKTLQMQLTECKETNLTLTEKISEAESLAEQRRQQIGLLVARERKAMKQKQHMHRLLHKARSQVVQNLSMMDAKFAASYEPTVEFDDITYQDSSQNSFDEEVINTSEQT